MKFLSFLFKIGNLIFVSSINLKNTFSMKNILIIAGFLLFMTACQNDNKDKAKQEEQVTPEQTQDKEQQASQNDYTQDEGYVLMTQNCYSCHIEKPDPNKKDKMLAPPMSNVQQHYKAAFTTKEEFVNAIVNWVNKPEETKLMMPGAARKFGLMPPLPIGDDKLTKIAETLYDFDFGKVQQGKGMMRNQTMDNTKGKTKLNPEDIKRVHAVIDKLNNQTPKTVAEYQALGKEVFDDAKGILLNKNYTDETLQQVQTFFHNTEDDMHSLMAVETVEEGQKYQKLLQEKFNKFDQYFE